MALTLLASAPAAAGLGPTRPAASSTAGAVIGRPDIVLLLTDDQTVESASRMPYLQRGVRDGTYVTFTQAEVNNSLCCPSRSAIMSGQVDTRNGVRNNSMGRRLDVQRTVQVALHDAGYRTGL